LEQVEAAEQGKAQVPAVVAVVAAFGLAMYCLLTNV
jgi:hypothetical protein